MKGCCVQGALVFLIAICLIGASTSAGQRHEAKPLRAGIIGLDTSHAVAFTKLFNDPKAPADLAGIKVVAAYPGGSADVPESRDRVQKFTTDVRAMGVEIVESIPALLDKVDVVMLESVDGRPHLQQVRPVFQTHKPVFIDKPLAGSLADAIAIQQLGEKYNVPWFSSSALRFGPTIEKLRDDPSIGDVVGCTAWSPCPLESHHPDLFWYGIHGVELLYTVMGPGCQSVTRVHTDGADCVIARWKDGRIGTFRGIRKGKEDYGAVIFGTMRVATALGFEGYQPLVRQIALFFETGKPPVSAQETIELMAFMEAADQSKRQHGRPVDLETVLAKARHQAAGS